ncbi:DNA-directed DNA polymerase [Malassezia brasiliensis]|uniref:DNA-directed DNA polymerase n=1 Tax=Malassezia brasiliensis TaxID=1821822 RepID=A0AAF0DQW5_9BASI|nr:DNA-directed DNA polymerase [Malassezia brasiliensis]
MGSTLALFWSLADVDKDARIGASDALVQTLLEQQIDESAAGAPGDAEVAALPDVPDSDVAAAEQRIDEQNASEVAYALRRLVRGLASPRENARLGFAVALSELLGNLSTVSAYDVLVLLLKNTVVHGSMSGQEVRDAQFARLFGIYALVRSRLLYHAASSSLMTFQRTFELLLTIASYKSWLSESCGYVLLESLAPLSHDHVHRPAWAHEALEWVAQRVGSTKYLSPPLLALLATLARIDPSISLEGRIPAPLKSANLLASNNLPVVARVLREATPLYMGSDAVPPTGGTWNTKPPFVWDTLLDAYFTNAVPPNSAPFADFWRVAVDESLFANQASPERKSWGFQVLHYTLQRAPADLLPFLFTPNLMRTWVNQVSVKDRLLHSMAQKTVEYVSDAVKRNPTAGLALVTQLLGEHGRQNFDKVTHTKTIESILSSLDESGIQRYLAYLRGVAYAPTKSDDAKYAATQRQWAADQMLALVRSSLIPKSDAWIRDVLVYLSGFGFFVVKKTPSAPWSEVLEAPTVPFTEEIQALYRLRLQACLTELKNATVNGRPWVLEVTDLLGKMSKDKALLSTALPAAQTRVDAAAGVLRSLQKVAAKESDDAQLAKIRALQTLVAAVKLVTYEDTDESPDLVDPLVDVAKFLFLDKKRAKDESVGAMELLVDALIGLLELSSSFLRAIATQVFSVFSDEMTAQSLDHLIDQFGLNVGGHEDEEDGEEDEEEEEMEEEEEEEEEEDEEDEDEEEDDVNEDQDIDLEVDPVLRSKIEEAFRDSGMAEDDEADGNDEDLFDDDQMAQLDDKLAEIFVQHSGSKRKEREALQRDTALFHNKILDLLEMYAKEQSSNILLVRLAAPLFALAKGAGDVSQQVATRAGQLLRGRICRSKEQPHGDLDVALVEEELRAMHTYVRASQDVALSELAGLVSQFYTKVLLRNSHDGLKIACSLYEETLNDFLQRKASPVRPAFLLDALRRFPELGWALRGALLEGSRHGARAFRQVQALSMLQAVLQQQQQNDTRQASTDDVLTFMAQVREAVLAVVRAATTSDVLNSQRLKEVLRFTLHAIRITARIAAESDDTGTTMAACWPLPVLQQTAESLQTSDRFQSSTSLHGLMKEMISIVSRTATAPTQTKKRAAPSSVASKGSKKATKKAKAVVE